MLVVREQTLQQQNKMIGLFIQHLHGAYCVSGPALSILQHEHT